MYNLDEQQSTSLRGNACSGKLSLGSNSFQQTRAIVVGSSALGIAEKKRTFFSCGLREEIARFLRMSSPFVREIGRYEMTDEDLYIMQPPLSV